MSTLFIITTVVTKVSSFEKLLTGNLNDLPPQRFSVVRIFLSSTFSGKFESSVNHVQSLKIFTVICVCLKLIFWSIMMKDSFVGYMDLSR